MRRELAAMGTAYAKTGTAGTGSKAGKVGRLSLWAVGSHEGFEHERALGRQRPGDLAGSAAYSPWSPAAPLLPRTHPGALTPTGPGWALTAHCLGSKTCPPTSMQEAGLWSQAEKLRTCSQVPGQQAWTQQLCVGLAPGHQSLGTDSLRRNAVPSQGSQQGQGEGSSLPYPQHVGNCAAAPARPWE